jgi:hypothetical protein
MIAMSILGRERDFEPGEFGLQFSLGGLVDEGKSSPILAASREVLESKTGLVLNKGVPASSDVDRFSSHKV